MNKLMVYVVMAAMVMTTSAPVLALQALPRSSDNHHIALRAEVGIVNGLAGEYVYDGAHTLSELLWDIDAIVMAGVNASWRFADRWSLNSGFWTALNKGNGEMTDKDFYIYGYSEWTHYSRHEVEIEKGRVIDINIGYRLNPAGRTAFTALIGYRQDIWEWTDSAQEYIYSERSFRDTHGHFEGVNAIDYKQTFDIPYAGLHVTGPVGTQFNWEASIIASVFGSAEALDHHILRDLRFKDTFSGLTYLALNLGGSYAFNEQSSLELSLHGQHVPESKGDSVILNDGSRFPDGGGIALDTIMLSVGYTHRF